MGSSVTRVRGAADDSRRAADMFDAGEKTTHEPPSEKKPPAVCRCFPPLTQTEKLVLLLLGILTCVALLTLQQHKLQNRYDNLNDTFNTLRANHSELLSRYQTLSGNHSRALEQLQRLMEAAEEGRPCPVGWIRFGCSCYFRSPEENTWFFARFDCVERRARLVVINTPEEQEFVTKLSSSDGDWIGLRTQILDSGKRWRWEGGVELPQTWMAAKGLKAPTEFAVVSCDGRGAWTPSDADVTKKTWICEKPVSFCC